MKSVPLYQAKAELFRALGHPVRIRVLELLLDGPQLVQALIADIEIEAASLSQQLAVLRRSGLVNSERIGTSVSYSLSAPEVGELMAAARKVLGEVLLDRKTLLAELNSTSTS